MNLDYQKIYEGTYFMKTNSAYIYLILVVNQGS